MDAGQRVCFSDRRGGHQLFQWLEVSEEISQLLEHSNPGALDTRWQIKGPPGRRWNAYWTLLPLICIAPLCEVLLSPYKSGQQHLVAHSVIFSELIKHSLQITRAAHQSSSVWWGHAWCAAESRKCERMSHFAGFVFDWRLRSEAVMGVRNLIFTATISKSAIPQKLFKGESSH